MAKEARRLGGPGPRFGWVPILVPLGLGFVASILLAWQAFDAGRRHREAARAMARENAQFAAYLLASTVDRTLSQALSYGLYPADVMLRREGDPPAPGILRTDPEASRCEPALAADERSFFRYDPATGEILVDGAGGDRLAERLQATIAATLPAEEKRETFRHAAVRVDGDRRWVAFRRWGEDHGGIVYGFETCWRVQGENVFERAMAGTQAFSPTLVGDTPNDSLFTLAVRDAEGELVFGERWTRPETDLYGGGDFYGTVRLSPPEAYGGLELRVTLLPAVAERLVQGGLPESRLPLALGLVILTGLLMWLAVGQLRRGHELVRLRSGFIRNVSHELRTPLQQILLFTELLRSGRIRDAGDRKRALEIMEAETRRLIELVRNVLRFTGSSETDLRRDPVDLASVARETAEGFRPLADGRGSDIEIREHDRPRVLADERALKRVLVNLLDNAVKYGPPGSRIRVDISTVDSRGRVTVSDRGPGVPAEDRQRIWEAFRRLEREEAGPTAGSGIGLSIVQRLVEAMEGSVSVEDAPGGGARFVVELPLREEAS
ncbi:MAG: HAMP domain-containing sensor histidine kinase [Gemmatimonadota bacterium]|nr:HAMP domain-containing sensor histidine kinase [Gemmatimonadota bacterium]